VKVSVRLFNKLVIMGLKPTSYPKRTYAGWQQRSNGTYRWFCEQSGGYIGSTYSMSDCLKSPELEYNSVYGSDIEISPKHTK
jgi:hypothetical protein